MVYPIGRFIVPPIYKLWLRRVKGLNNVPKDKPFIMAANHTSYYDVLLLPCIIVPKINKKIHALVNNYYWRNFFTRFFLDLWENIPVFVDKEKNTKENNKLALKKALQHLKNNELIMIFPEGRRSYDGKLNKAYAGIARLALQAQVPILPCGIIGSNQVLPKGKILPRFTKCEVKIGKLMYFKKYYNKKPTKKILDNITRSIMKEIGKLIGQKYNY